MPHSASASGLPPASLLGPTELPDLGSRVATGGADLLLDVEGDLATPPAQGVGLVAPLTKGTGTLGHDEAGLSSEILYRLVNHGGNDDVNRSQHVQAAVQQEKRICLELQLLEEPLILSCLVSLFELCPHHVSGLLLLHGILQQGKV